MTPEEILAIVSLYENERQNTGYRSSWNNLDPERSHQTEEETEDDEDWLDAPVNPHVNIGGHSNDIGPAYFLDNDKYLENKGRWGGFSERNKRFMVAKRRNDPTRELRYLNGPSKNDFYTLHQLLSNQREPNVPLYRRAFL